jgi:hypothetical protein
VTARDVDTTRRSVAHATWLALLQLSESNPTDASHAFLSPRAQMASIYFSALCVSIRVTRLCISTPSGPCPQSHASAWITGRQSSLWTVSSSKEGGPHRE